MPARLSSRCSQSTLRARCAGPGLRPGANRAPYNAANAVRRVLFGPGGWAEFPALAFGKGIVIARAKGFSRAKQHWLKVEEELEIYVEPEARLTGRVLDEVGSPPAVARVMLSWGRGEMMNVPIAPEDGRYAAAGLPAGRYSVAVVDGAGAARFSEAVDLRKGETLTGDIRIMTPKPGEAGRPR